jgi:hypothetical protein
VSQLIGPDGLEPDAVVPQCLDNQYVSADVFSDMIDRGADYQDQRVTDARERDFRTEFLRSLVYSSQVVIQRAFLKNSEFLYKNYQPQNVAGLRAFAALMRDHAIVPYLWAESSLTDKLVLEVRNEGDRAVQALLEEAGDDVRCVRLAVDDTANAQAAEIMATDFGNGLTRLVHLDSPQRNAMAAELVDKHRREKFDEPGSWLEFERAVDDLAGYAFGKATELRREGKKLSRQYVYQDRFAAGDDETERAKNVALGRFKQPSAADPYLLELKKYVDLVYNVNLPDHLRRYTFTPVNMPSRMALQDTPREGFRGEQIRTLATDPDALEWIRRSFLARAQAAMTLPLLSELSMADVVAIRALDEWASFKDAQQEILRDPLRCLENIEAFQESFDHFQRALSDWYNRTYERERTVHRYCSFVTLALSVGGVLAVAGSHLGAMPHDLAGLAAPEIAKKIPQRIKGYAAKLMVGVYDIGAKRLDADRSYTIELMHTGEELMRDEVIELLRSMDRAENALPRAPDHVADQGIQ